MTAHSCFRTFLIASLITVGCLALPGAVASAEEVNPHEPGSSAESAARVTALRAELAALRQRLDQLERMRPVDAGPGRAIDPGERARLLAETGQILAQFNDGKAHAWKEAHGKIRGLRLEVAAALTEIQEGYTRGARLDEAVAIRHAIAFIRNPGWRVLADPGLLRTTGDPERILFFRVTGANSGSVYGTEVYTSDSSLAAAAVHAGVLKAGQTGIVKVTTIRSHPGYVSSTRNGITSSAWGSYAGFRVEALGDEDQDLNEGETGVGAVVKTPPPTPCASGPGYAAPKPGTPRVDPSLPDCAAALPAEARARLAQFHAATSDLRQSARDQVCRLAREAVDRLASIQDSHTRAARLDEAIAVRDVIRRLAECAGRQP